MGSDVPRHSMYSKREKDASPEPPLRRPGRVSLDMTPDTDAPGDYQVPEDDDALLVECEMETFRAGGPGGQHQNKTESAVRLTHVPTGLSVTARESRSQHRNRKIALARLRGALEEAMKEELPRRPTRVPGRERQKRLEEKRRRSAVKRARKKPEPED